MLPNRSVSDTFPARAAGIDDDVPAVDEAEIGETSEGEIEGPAESSAEELGDAETTLGDSAQSALPSEELEVAPADAPDATEVIEGSDEAQEAAGETDVEEVGEPAGAAASYESDEPAGATTRFQTKAGGCTLVLDSAGTLTIKPTNNTSGTLPDQPLFGYLMRHERYSSKAGSWYLIHDYAPEVRKVVVANGVKAASSLCAAFTGLSRIESVDLSKLDASSTNDLSSMFSECLTLRKVVLPRNLSNVTNTESMFDGCCCLVSVNLSPFRGATLTKISYVFRSTALRQVDLTGIQVEPAAVGGEGVPCSSNTDGVFRGCKSIKSFTVPASWPMGGERWWNRTGWTETVTFPEATSADGTWWSDRDGAYFTNEQLKERAGIADTYYNDDYDAYDSCSWKRLWGKNSIATMAAIVREGRSDRLGGTARVQPAPTSRMPWREEALRALTEGRSSSRERTRFRLVPPKSSSALPLHGFMWQVVRVR